MKKPFPRLVMLASFFLLASLGTSCSVSRPANLALRKPAFHSSSIDFNATAQLAVDGIVETSMPRRFEVCGNGGVPLGKREHDIVFDPRQWTSVISEGGSAEISVRTQGFNEPVDRMTMTVTASLPAGARDVRYTAELAQMDENGSWSTVRRFEGNYPGRQLTMEWDPGQRISSQGWRWTVEIPGARAIEWREWRLYRDGELLPMLNSGLFNSSWISATGGKEWLAVDLGEEKRFSEVRLHWLNGPSAGAVQVSADSTAWRDISKLSGNVSTRVDILKVRGRGRWVRILLDSSIDGKPYVLSELEVIGSSETSDNGITIATPQAKDGRICLDSGWQLARLPQAGDPAAWIPATVPGTVLVSYLDNGMLPDPNFSENQQYISDSYFLVPFVYRTRFTLPGDYRKGDGDERIRLHFDGINWKADVSLNGSAVGRIEGAFTDASFDVTPLLAEENILEVTVYPPAHPGMTKTNTKERCATNGGVLGADNPTFHASIGWDWIPTIRGRNTGIWNDVWLGRTCAVRILDPTVRFGFNTRKNIPAALDTTRVTVILGATLANDTGHAVETVWEGSFGEMKFSVPVTVPAGASIPVSTGLDLKNPKLWWPNGYGEPYLYDVTMTAGGSDSVSFRSGVRHLAYSTQGNNLRIWINGRRLVGRGGNWGFSESNLRYKESDYETAMQLHRHENFNLVRNWVGMIGDEEFYEAADRNGILIWQDFWLANPADGPDPDDEELFMANARNMMHRIRNHPSLLLWCGRNEGYPPASLDKALRELVASDDPDSFYLSSSADDIVSGRGTYYRLPSKDYWRLDATPWFRNESVMFHSERGMPNFPNYESLLLMMTEDEAWPPSRMWGIHDFALESAQRGRTFIAAVDSFFGPSADAKTFASRAQWVNYEGYRSMFESRSRNRRGLLLWMSHPAWPSMAFCTYDFFLDATAAYYACRNACEPVHIQWNPVAGKVEVANYSAGNLIGLRAGATLYDMKGKEVSSRGMTLDSREDSTTGLFGIDFPAAGFAPGDTVSNGVCFLRLQLFDGERLISHNDYVLPQKEDNLQALSALPKTSVSARFFWDIDSQVFKASLANESDTPALMLHLTARGQDGERILPAMWSDNYIHLMPGEERTLTLNIPGGEFAYSLRIEGFNTEPLTVREKTHTEVVE